MSDFVALRRYQNFGYRNVRLGMSINRDQAATDLLNLCLIQQLEAPQ